MLSALFHNYQKHNSINETTKCHQRTILFRRNFKLRYKYFNNKNNNNNKKRL